MLNKHSFWIESALSVPTRQKTKAKIYLFSVNNPLIMYFSPNSITHDEIDKDQTQSISIGQDSTPPQHLCIICVFVVLIIET